MEGVEDVYLLFFKEISKQGQGHGEGQRHGQGQRIRRESTVSQ
jgi:hypothetical protein